MNGNAVFATDFFDRHANLLIGPATMGWDYFYRGHYIEISRDSDLIYQHYNRYNNDPGRMGHHWQKRGPSSPLSRDQNQSRPGARQGQFAERKPLKINPICGMVPNH